MTNTNFYGFANKIYSATGETQAELERETMKLRGYLESTDYVKALLSQGRSAAFGAAQLMCKWFWYGVCNNLFGSSDEVIKFVQSTMNLADLYRNEGVIGEGEHSEIEYAVKRCVAAIYENRPDFEGEICA